MITLGIHEGEGEGEGEEEGMGEEERAGGEEGGGGSTFHQIPGNNYKRDNRIGKSSFGTNLIITDSDKNKQKMLKLVIKDLIRNRILT